MIQVDDDFIVEATLTNPSDSQTMIDFAYAEEDYEIDLRDSSGIRVPESAYGRRAHSFGSVGSTRMVPFLPTKQ